MRQTSIEAYNKIKEDGLLSKSRMEIYDILFKYGAMTAGEIFEVLQKRKIAHTVVKGSVCARLTELERVGVVMEVGKKEWLLTGQSNTLWGVTDRLPMKPEKKKTKDQIIRELREEIEELKNALRKYEPNRCAYL